MMLAGGSAQEYEVLKNMSVGEYLNKMDIFVDKLEAQIKSNKS